MIQNVRLQNLRDFTVQIRNANGEKGKKGKRLHRACPANEQRDGLSLGEGGCGGSSKSDPRVAVSY